MGQTIKRYPVWEIAVVTQSYAPLTSGHERVVEGDIVAARFAGSMDGIGVNERTRHLWLRVEGWEEHECWLTEGVEGYEKRRYQVPLARLKTVCPDLDLAAARDTTAVHQPWLVTDEDTGLFLTIAATLNVQGLVFDTVTGEYR